ncbi:MAG TPA: tail fiber domain-containing protein [Candidatus Udaeobacter sp.]|nr:tail fiber domain-containing protein [Candidatus Udaeobacter sp.]
MRYGLFLIPFVLAALALSQTAPAQLSPPPDGGYAGDNTAEGTDSLFSLTTGTENTAIGFDALFSNTTGDSNTATGSIALSTNTTGVRNTANGFAALNSNTTGERNTATGRAAMTSNTTGNNNTADGHDALFSNTTAIRNTATGSFALFSNTTGPNNTAIGYFALFSNTTGNSNTASGYDALLNNTTGVGNIALGNFAGSNLTTGDNNIDIGNLGVAGEGNTIRIGTEGTQANAYLAGIYQTNIAKGLVVKVDSDGHLGTVGSSERFKDAVKPMDKASEAILALKPVTFHYKKEFDSDGTPQFGLVAEEVEKVNPDLVVRDADGKPYTVRYEAVNAMLLNEFLKEHRKVEQQEATITQQRKQFEAAISQQQKEIKTLAATVKEQASQIQKVSAQLEMTRPAPQTVLNDR